MDKHILRAYCRTGDFTSVENTIRNWDSVVSVGSIREKHHNRKDITTVFITFDTDDALKEAEVKIKSVIGIIPGKDGDRRNENSNSSTRRKAKNLAAQFLQYEYVDMGVHAKGDERGHQEHRSGRRREGPQRGRGGRGTRGRGINTTTGIENGRGRGRSSKYQHISPRDVHVAYVDNLPFCTTNDQLMESVGSYGHVLDITRLELMAMICYDNPESVQLCIQNLNGKEINGSTVVVSSGTVQIPGYMVGHLNV